MKRILVSMLIMFVGVGMAFSQIQVTSPNGGESWAKTTTHNVTWNTGGVAGNVIIQLMQGGASQGAIYNGSNSGSFSWTVDNYLSASPIAVGAYKLQVKSLSDTSIKDQSNADFNVTAAPSPAGSITVNDPNGGECWETGSTHNVLWSSSDVSGNVIIQLFQGGTSQGAIYNGANSGSFSWTINNYLNATPIAVGNYRLQIKSLDDASVLDQSNSTFEISNDCDSGGDDGDPFDPAWFHWLKEKLEAMRWIEWRPPKWPWPGPGPWPDPWFKFDKFREIFAKAKFRGQVKFELFKGGVKVGDLGTFGKRLRRGDVLKKAPLTVMPRGIAMKGISKMGRKMLKTGGGYILKLKFANGKSIILNNFELKEMKQLKLKEMR